MRILLLLTCALSINNGSYAHRHMLCSSVSKPLKDMDATYPQDVHVLWSAYSFGCCNTSSMFPRLQSVQRRSAHGICTSLAFQLSLQRAIPESTEEILLPEAPVAGCQRSGAPSLVECCRSSHVRLCFAGSRSCLKLSSSET